MLQNWNDATMDARNALVFEGRNQAYGAFVLRQQYNKRITYIVGGVLLFSILLFGLKSFIDNRPKEEEKPIDMSNIVVDLTPPPPQEEQPPPPPPPPPPMVEMVKFVPPVIKDDAVEEEPQKLQEEVKESNVGTKDQEGEKDLPVVPSEETGPAETAPEIFTVVEEMPEFPGGAAEMMKYIQKNIQYPTMAREAGIGGKCFLKFVVNGDGVISDVQVLKGVSGCGDCDKEAIRVVKSMPKWKAGKQNGRSVPVYFNLPINFTIK